MRADRTPRRKFPVEQADRLNQPHAAKDALRRLQGSAGNRAVARSVQRSLTVGSAHDPSEREADVVAEEVSRFLQRRRHQPVEERGGDLPAGTVSRSSDASSEAGGPLEAEHQSAIDGLRPTGRRLEPAVRSGMESAFNADFGTVRIHDGPDADSVSRSIGAEAFTTGADIFFRGGAFRPSTDAGQRLLAHELTHVVQQGSAPARAADAEPEAPR